MYRHEGVNDHDTMMEVDTSKFPSHCMRTREGVYVCDMLHSAKVISITRMQSMDKQMKEKGRHVTNKQIIHWSTTTTVDSTDAWVLCQ